MKKYMEPEVHQMDFQLERQFCASNLVTGQTESQSFDFDGEEDIL